jgi:hypothetical protein
MHFILCPHPWLTLSSTEHQSAPQRVLETFRLPPASLSCNLGCIDVNSGALEASSLGICKIRCFFFLEKDFWCFAYQETNFLPCFFKTALRNAGFGWWYPHLCFSFPKSVLISLPRKKSRFRFLLYLYT